MNKLQLYITKSYNGYKSLVNFNPSEDVSVHVHDLCEAVKLVDYVPTEKNIFYLLSYTAEGVFYTIIRTIPSRRNDHLAAWIYVPNGLGITPEQLEEIIKTTSRKVSMSSVGDKELAELREIFSREYTLDREAPAIVANHGDRYAYAYYGTETLQLPVLFERGLFQPAYLPYKGVILLEEALQINVAGDDLSHVEPEQVVTILPPAEGSDFTPYIYGKPLDRPYRVALNSNIKLTWRRQGFQDVHQEVTITGDDFVPEAVDTAESCKIITPNSFHITSQFSKAPIEDASIVVNGVEITAEGHAFTQGELEKSTVSISAEGYQPHTGHYNLASAARTLVQMRERGKVYRFELPVKSSEYGVPVKFEITSKKPLSGSPIDGYTLLDEPLKEGPSRMNHLGYMYGAKHQALMFKAMYVGIGLLVGILLMLMFGKCGGGSSDQKAALPTENVQSAPSTADGGDNGAVADNGSTNTATPAASASTAVLPSSVSEAAIAYVSNNKTWTKSDLEKNGLNGLFEDLNNFNLDRIINGWGPLLSKSSYFKKVVDSAELSKKKVENKKKPLDLHRDGRSTYTKNESINYYGWCCWVDPQKY